MYVTYGINVFGIDPSLDRYEIANQAIEKTTQIFDTPILAPLIFCVNNFLNIFLTFAKLSYYFMILRLFCDNIYKHYILNF